MARFSVRRCVCLFLSFALVPCHSQSSEDQFLPMKESLLPLHSAEGRRLLRESKAQEAYWLLSQFYAVQPDLGSCSVGSCVMVLNALPIPRPVSRTHAPFRLFTSDNFFTDKVSEIIPRKRVSVSGMTLKQLSEVLAVFPVTVEPSYASDSNIKQFRKTLEEALSHPDKYVIVNYLRKTLGQEGGGHISPVGAYNTKEDRVLVVDTAAYKFPWTWVKTADLWSAMEATDADSKRTRGYLVVYPRKK